MKKFSSNTINKLWIIGIVSITIIELMLISHFFKPIFYNIIFVVSGVIVIWLGIFFIKSLNSREDTINNEPKDNI